MTAIVVSIEKEKTKYERNNETFDNGTTIGVEFFDK